jgi:ribosomal protein L11
MEPGMPIPVVITVLPGQVVHLRHQDAAGLLLLKKAADQSKKGSKLPGTQIVGKVTMDQAARSRRRRSRT